MVYRSSRRPKSTEPEGENFTLQPEDADSLTKMDVKRTDLRRQVGYWRTATLCFMVFTIALAIALMAVSLQKDGLSAGPECGADDDYEAIIDLSEPDNPGPFHDLTKREIKELREFLEKEPHIKAVKAENAGVSDSAIFMMDLAVPNKSAVLNYLDHNGKQPVRQARVIMFRGDRRPPVVEEYICGPLPGVTDCFLPKSDKRRNPAEFSLRPVSPMEYDAVYNGLVPRLEKEIGFILKESYGTSLFNCGPVHCFRLYPSPIASNLVNDINKRLLWMIADFHVEYYILHPSGFGILMDLSDPDPSKHVATNIWYGGQLFENPDEFIRKYNSSTIKKVRMSPPKYSKDVYSSLHQRGEPLPKKPQRPPTLVEPDGKRYTLKDRKVEYLGWSFNFRMSSLAGPALFDVKYKDERIVYELSLSEIAVFYSAYNPMHRVTDYADSGALLGTHSKALVPGGDCPESATFINQTFSAQALSDSSEISRAFCLFENNNGYPLRRHLSYTNFDGAFYGGMLDSVLVLRSILTVVNYDYVIDFIFHQNGVMETKVMSTGYIFPSHFTRAEKPYGFHIEENILGNIHHHMFHFKADLDISGTSNRYETLDIKREEVKLRVKPGNAYPQNKFERNLKSSEKAALYQFNFDQPRYHLVHNNAKKSKFNEMKAYRIGLDGMSKQLLPENKGNEGAVPWARYQLAVTKHKDEEFMSSSPYAMWDSLDPVTNFTKFFADDEGIVDEDLVFWITQGMHHIPHTEDLPVTPTVGNHLTFFFFPYNYFDDCPSMASRDQIHIELKDHSDPAKGVKIDRNGNTDKQCVIPQVASAYDQLLEDDPDVAVESRKFKGIL